MTRKILTLDNYRLMKKGFNKPDPDGPGGAGAFCIRRCDYMSAISFKEWPRDGFHDYKDVEESKLWQALKEIAIGRGIKLVIDDFPENNTFAGFISRVRASSEFVIVINDRVPNVYKPLVLAHELAHHQLHRNVLGIEHMGNSLIRDRYEQEADNLANRLISYLKQAMKIKNTQMLPAVA